ncbi:hypothetical protein ACWKWU_21035 [Chitinophaga lutea]
MQYRHKLINKAVKHYHYDGPVELELSAAEFWDGYQYDYNDYKESRYDFNTFIGSLDGVPESTHNAAKKMLWQGDSRCWAYFERTALFWTVSDIADEWLDHQKDALEFALYTERNDLLELLIQKTHDYIQAHQSEKDYQRQSVYPSTYLSHFLAGKWLGHNAVLEQVLQYGKGYGIYQPLIDHWDDYTKLDHSYWDSLCEYHLDQISLTKADHRDYEEFIGAGLVPVELVNLIKVRRKLGLDVPEIRHELFETPMAAMPVVPTGYNENYDLFYQTVKRTAETGKLFNAGEMIEYIRETYGPGEILEQ